MAESRGQLVPMEPRDPDEDGRVATTLELFFDLVFVIAVAAAAHALAHEIANGHFGSGIVAYLMVFFAIWWAWMNFTWFASAFDNDDWLYRILTFVQMGGVLVLAAGVQDTFRDSDLLIVTVGYVVMRIALVAQWLRAAHGSPLRRTAHAYAAGVTIVQALWVGRLFLPDELHLWTAPLLVVAEMSVPYLAERIGETPWHAHHLAERYGLFTIILLGESLLASATAIIEALHGKDPDVPRLIALATLALVVSATLWWIYFWSPHHHRVSDANFLWGYGHYVVFAAAGAIAAGFEVQVELITHHAHIGDVQASYAVTVPIAVFLLGVWWLAIRHHGNRTVNVAVPVGALLVLADPLIPVSVTISAVVLIAVVAVLVRNPPSDAAPLTTTAVKD